MKFTIFGAGIIFTCIMLALIKNFGDADMAKCQEKFSYDTCFQMLNR